MKQSYLFIVVSLLLSLLSACGGGIPPFGSTIQTDKTGQPTQPGQPQSQPQPQPQPGQTQPGQTQPGQTQPGQTQPGQTQPQPKRDCSGGPLSAPIANCRPTVPPSTGDLLQDCVNRINQFRHECLCLPPLKRWREGEACAQKHAQNDSVIKIAHHGFTNTKKICGPRGPGAFAQNECPGYRSNEAMIGTCLQQMWDEGPGQDFLRHGHYINMTSDKYTKVACGFSNGWGVQNFSN